RADDRRGGLIARLSATRDGGRGIPERGNRDSMAGTKARVAHAGHATGRDYAPGRDRGRAHRRPRSTRGKSSVTYNAIDRCSGTGRVDSNRATRGPAMTSVEVTIDSIAAGGDGIAR